MDPETLRRHAEAIFRAGVEGADAATAVASQIRMEGRTLLVGEKPYDLDAFRRIRVVGMGKASAAMAAPLAELLGDRITDGLIIVKEGYGKPLSRVRVMEAGHPVPDQRGVEAVTEMLKLLEGGTETDLVFCLISGGGSALSPAPRAGITLAEKQHLTRILLSSGATIHEINTIRKHLSCIKGGGLAAVAHPATLVSLILSDVPGDDLDTIASGPTVPDRTSFRDCLEILGTRNLESQTPPSVLGLLASGVRGETPETPKAGNPIFGSVRNLIVGNNRMALGAAEARARELGYHTLLPTGQEEGEARDVARSHVALAREIRSGARPASLPACVLTGGETTVTVRGSGRGGRNQEFALAAALAADGMRGIAVLSGGTDGTDGPTDAAGAVADGDSVARGRAMGMEAEEYLDRNDSNAFFRRLGNLLVTGPTFTNVMDLRVVLVDQERGADPARSIKRA